MSSNYMSVDTSRIRTSKAIVLAKMRDEGTVQTPRFPCQGIHNTTDKMLTAKCGSKNPDNKAQTLLCHVCDDHLERVEKNSPNEAETLIQNEYVTFDIDDGNGNDDKSSGIIARLQAWGSKNPKKYTALKIGAIAAVGVAAVGAACYGIYVAVTKSEPTTPEDATQPATTKSSIITTAKPPTTTPPNRGNCQSDEIILLSKGKTNTGKYDLFELDQYGASQAKISQQQPSFCHTCVKVSPPATQAIDLKISSKPEKGTEKEVNFQLTNGKNIAKVDDFEFILADSIEKGFENTCISFSPRPPAPKVKAKVDIAERNKLPLSNASLQVIIKDNKHKELFDSKNQCYGIRAYTSCRVTKEFNDLSADKFPLTIVVKEWAGNTLMMPTRQFFLTKSGSQVSDNTFDKCFHIFLKGGVDTSQEQSHKASNC